jgi:hypothetical protein
MSISLRKIFPWINAKEESSYPVLKKGSINEYVGVVQQQLQLNGFYGGRIDNDFGTNTHNAVVHFQQTHLGPDKKPLDDDGIVGEDTWWALYNPLAVEKTEKKVKKSNNNIPANLSPDREKVLKLAIAEFKKPVKEIPNGSNWGPDVKKYLQYCGLGPAAWCACFVNWIVGNTLNKIPWGAKIARVSTLYTKGKTLGMSHSINSAYKPRPGDLYIIVHSDGTGHVGIILRVSRDGKALNVIEGNSANKVALRTRVVGAGNHVGYMNYFDDADDSYDFEKGLIASDNTGLDRTR